MSKILIMADSSGDIRPEEAKEYGIRVLPFKTNFGDGIEYRDRVDITTEEFYKRMREGNEAPKTVQITPAEFEDEYKKAAAEGYTDIVMVTIGSTASGTNQSATIAKGVVEDEGIVNVEIVDSLHLAFGTGHATICGAKYLAENPDASAKDVADRIREVLSHTQSFFVVETLEYLRRGGRIKSATAVIGGVLDIRPILYVNNGVVESLDKVRGAKKVLPKFIEILHQKAPNPDEAMFFVLDGDAEEQASALAKRIEEEIGRPVDMRHDVGITIGAHAGPGVLGLCIVDKKF
ncbi:MAG: DegV family protein [Clostridia bacterium]|nr:DegV family protein [Clostridia bacterium]